MHSHCKGGGGGRGGACLHMEEEGGMPSHDRGGGMPSHGRGLGHAFTWQRRWGEEGHAFTWKTRGACLHKMEDGGAFLTWQRSRGGGGGTCLHMAEESGHAFREGI